MGRHAIAAAVAILIACSGPGREENGRSAPVEAGGAPPAALLALMDTAATEYRGTEFENARALYRSAATLDSSLAAPWFGLFLAHHALGQIEAADSALAKARRLAQRE